MNRIRTAASTSLTTLITTTLLAATAFGHVDAQPHLHTDQGVVSLSLHWIGAAGILLAAVLLRRRTLRSIRQQ